MQKLMVVLLLQSDGEDAVDYAKVNGIDPRWNVDGGVFCDAEVKAPHQKVSEAIINDTEVNDEALCRNVVKAPC